MCARIPLVAAILIFSLLTSVTASTIEPETGLSNPDPSESSPARTANCGTCEALSASVVQQGCEWIVTVDCNACGCPGVGTVTAAWADDACPGSVLGGSKTGTCTLGTTSISLRCPPPGAMTIRVQMTCGITSQFDYVAFTDVNRCLSCEPLTHPRPCKGKGKDKCREDTHTDLEDGGTGAAAGPAANQSMGWWPLGRVLSDRWRNPPVREATWGRLKARYS